MRSCCAMRLRWRSQFCILDVAKPSGDIGFNRLSGSHGVWRSLPIQTRELALKDLPYLLDDYRRRSGG